MAAIDENDFVWVRKSTKSGTDDTIRFPSRRFVIRTTRSGSRNGNGLSSTPSMTLKIAVVAPMARASVNAAMIVKPGVRESFRAA